MGYGRFPPFGAMQRGRKTGSRVPEAPQGLSIKAFQSWMIARGYAPESAKAYGDALRKSMADPVEYMRKVGSHQFWLNCRAAWRLVAQWTGDPSIWEAVRGLPGPRKPPRRPRAVPTLEEWLQIGRRAWKTPGPLGAVVWLVLYSGMRIGDVLDISPGEIAEARGRGSTTCRQKGRGGNRRRSWTPGPLCRIALDRLAEETGFRHLWQILSTSKGAAEDRVNKCIPKPYSAHCFRHATPTYLVALGMDLPTIATITGHESLSSLENYIRTSIAVPASRTYAAQDRLMRAILSAGDSETESHRSKKETPKG